MRLICGHCANYHHEPFHEDRCLRNGKIVGFLWERDCYEPKLNPNAESEQIPGIIEQETTITVQNQSEMEQNNNVTTKVCKECGRELPIEEFGKHARTKDVLQPLCRECRSKKVSGKHLKKDEDDTRIEARVLVTPTFEEALDQELVDELRARGWEVTCRRTIEL